MLKIRHFAKPHNVSRDYKDSTIMGTFLSFALVHKSLNETKKAILNYSKITQGDYTKIPDESIEEGNILYSTIKSLDKQTSIILLPDFSNELYDCSQSLSASQNSKVLAAHVHDGDVWLIYLFNKGKEITRYASDPILIEQKKEDWRLDNDIIESAYGISPEVLDTFLKNLLNRQVGGDVTNDLFTFLKELHYPIDIIRDFNHGHKLLVPSKELRRITKTFLTIDDLRKTKKYSSELIKLTNEELYELFGDEIDFIVSYRVCGACETPTTTNEYYLSIDTLCFQVKGRCDSCGGQLKLLLNYGFIHKMSEVRNFLNK